MFTQEEAVRFAEQHLSITDVREKLTSARADLLDDLAIAFHEKIPYTNIRLMSKEPQKRGKSSEDEIKSDILSGLGGLCYNLNICAFYLLQALGYEVKLNKATSYSTNDHVIIFVYNVPPTSDNFLFDVGSAYPTFRAINLGFDKETPEFRDSYLEYKFLKQEETGHLLRMHRRGDGARSLPENFKVFIDGWRIAQRIIISPTSRVEEFHSNYDRVLSDPEATNYHHVYRIVQFPEKRAIIMSNRSMLLENAQGDLERHAIEGGADGIPSALERYFPTIPAETARQAMVNWLNQSV